MKFDVTIWKTRLLVTWLICNLGISTTLANLYHVKKSVAVEDSVTGQPAQYDPQIGNLMGKPGEGYYMEVQIGTPPQKLNVLIDTGSSNFAIACKEDANIDTYFMREKSSTYENLGTAVTVPYTQGSWDGTLGQDYVTIATLPNSTVKANIACINKADNFFINNSNWQGIMGLGYIEIARPDGTVKPFMESLVEEKSMSNMFSVQLCGIGYVDPNPDKVVGGSLIFGNIAPPLYTGELAATPIYKEWYYEVVIVDVGVNGTSLNMDCKEYNFGKTIVDTGTTNLRLPSRVYDKLVSNIKHTVKSHNINIYEESFWSGEEVWCWGRTTVPYSAFPVIGLTLPGTHDTAAFKLNIPPQQYLRPVSEDYEAPVPGMECFKFAITPLDSGTVLGAIVLEGFYTVFNRSSKQLLFGESTCSVIDNTATKASITSNIPYSGDYHDCAYKKIENQSRTLTIVGYVLAGICGVCVLPLIFLVVMWQIRKSPCRRRLKRTDSDSNDLMEAS